MLPAEDSAERHRNAMVDRDIAGRGVADPAVLEAVRSVPRERFVPENMASHAFRDQPLPIGHRQTISQPFIVALMAEAAEISPSDKVLEIGAGSGYGAAVLGELASQVWTIERIGSLARSAAERLGALGYDNVHVIEADGTAGLPEQAPFDAIVVTAGGREIPQPLLDQLADGGRLIIPVGPQTGTQRLLRVRRDGAETTEEELVPVRFVPLVKD